MSPNTEKTVSVDDRGRVKLPEPNYKRYIVIKGDDGSYTLNPTVEIEVATLKKMEAAIQRVGKGIKGREVPENELAEIRRLLDQ